MKRFLSLCLLICVALGSLTGCHGSRSKAAFAVPADFDETKPCEITFWAKNDTNIIQTRIYEKAIADFQEIYPNIHVNLRLYTDYGKIYSDVITNISTNTTPNVCITYPDHIATYLAGQNSVVPLDDLMQDERFGLGGSRIRFDGPGQGEIAEQFLEECRIGGVHYAVPYMRSTEACYVNRTYVEKLGYTLPETLTWDFVWEVSDKAAEKNADGTYKINGQKTMIPFLYKSTDNMMIQSLKQLDAPFSDAAGHIGLFSEETKELLNTISAHTKAGAFSTFKISSYPANFLNAGQCVFAVDSTAGATWMGSEAPLIDIAPDKLVPFEIEVLTIPQYDPKNLRMISQGPSLCIFNKEDPQVVLASWIFVQYMLSNPVQIAYSGTEGYVPVTTKAQQSPEYQDYLSREGQDGSDHYFVKIRAAKLLLENQQNTFVTPVFNGSASLRDAAGHLIESVTKSTRRKETVDDAYIASLYENTRTLYHLDSSGAAPAEGKEDLGPLPTEAKALIAGLAAAWILMGIVVLLKKTDKRLIS